MRLYLLRAVFLENVEEDIWNKEGMRMAAPKEILHEQRLEPGRGAARVAGRVVPPGYCIGHPLLFLGRQGYLRSCQPGNKARILGTGAKWKSRDPLV